MKRDEFIKITGMGVGSLTLSPFHPRYEEKTAIYSLPQIIGDVSQTEAVLQTRLCRRDHLPFEQINTIEELLASDIEGAEGVARFEISKNRTFKEYSKSPWQKTTPERDFIVKYKITNLEPGTQYYMRVRFGENEENTATGAINQFSTLIDENVDRPISFVVQSCMSLAFFLLGRGGKSGSTRAALKEWEKRDAWQRPAVGKERELGYPALGTIADLKPHFWVLTGDNVYYDHPSDDQYRAKTKEKMRAKWHRQFSTSRINDAFLNTSTYWMVDDHDFRYNDSDNTENDKPPSADLAKQIFREQLPMNDFESDPDDGLYRSKKIGKHLQIWMTNGRFFRDPTDDPDGPEKSMFGKEQLEWLKETLLESEATFKVLISGTQFIGPSGGRYRGDSHSSYGFRYERDQFFNWLMKNGFLHKNLFFVCGNAHTRFHSISPTGFEEFSTGTITSQNVTVNPIKPGDAKGSDPLNLIDQPYVQNNQLGGFLKIDVVPPEHGFPPLIKFVSMDEKGNIENLVTRVPKKGDS